MSFLIVKFIPLIQELKSSVHDQRLRVSFMLQKRRFGKQPRIIVESFLHRSSNYVTNRVNMKIRYIKKRVESRKCIASANGTWDLTAAKLCSALTVTLSSRIRAYQKEFIGKLKMT